MDALSAYQYSQQHGCQAQRARHHGTGDRDGLAAALVLMILITLAARAVSLLDGSRCAARGLRALRCRRAASSLRWAAWLAACVDPDRHQKHRRHREAGADPRRSARPLGPAPIVLGGLGPVGKVAHVPDS